jgi:phage repressor protein C with HTH and peptisase S24 domain
MLKHREIWKALDKLAANHGLTASGLARRGGLDATAFNKSKRITPEGRPRWPGTESLAKVLAATGESLAGYASLLNERGAGRSIPLVGYAKAGAKGYFDDAGYPTGQGWDRVALPEVDDAHAYALRISGDSMEPAYRGGDIIVVSPASRPRRGDRVVVKTKTGEVMAKELGGQGGGKIVLRSLNAQHKDRSFAPRDIAWMARIVWVSQ